MTNKVQQMAPVIWEEIEKANSVLLQCHASPDADSIGSSLAFAHMLRSMGKRVTHIIGDSPKPSGIEILPGFDKIEEKNFFDVDLSKIDLFLALDSASLGQISRKREIVFPSELKTINIDHHGSNTNYAQINLVDTSYGSLAELVFDLFELWQREITPEIAICLFLGIYTDTGFKYPRTTSETFLRASKLAKVYPDFPRVIFQMENNEEPEKLAFLGLALSSIEHYFQDHVAVAAMPYDQLQKKGIQPQHMEKSDIANMLKSVVGWDIAITFTERAPGEVHLNLRTRNPDKYDVSKLAISLGGGGHSAAAGATIKKPFGEAKSYLLETIGKVFPELGTP